MVLILGMPDKIQDAQLNLNFRKKMNKFLSMSQISHRNSYTKIIMYWLSEIQF